MKLSKVCKNPECGCTFFKKETQSLINWKKQEYCMQVCKVSFKNKKAREKHRVKYKITRRRKKLNHLSLPAKDVLANFLSTRLWG